jgi:hypothetical protein
MDHIVASGSVWFARHDEIAAACLPRA